MNDRLRSQLLTILLALLVPLQAIAGVGGACCHESGQDDATAPAVHAAHHDAGHADDHAAPVPAAAHADCAADVLPCCHASTLAAPTVIVAPAFTALAMIPAVPRALIVSPPRSGPDRPPRPHTA